MGRRGRPKGAQSAAHPRRLRRELRLAGRDRGVMGAAGWVDPGTAPDSASFATPAGGGLPAELARFYRSGLHCDAALRCADGASVPCHRAVLAALSPGLADALASSAADGEDVSSVYLPGHDPAAVRRLADCFYGCYDDRGGVSDDDLAQMRSVYLALGVDAAPWSSLDPRETSTGPSSDSLWRAGDSDPTAASSYLETTMKEEATEEAQPAGGGEVNDGWNDGDAGWYGKDSGGGEEEDEDWDPAHFLTKRSSKRELRRDRRDDEDEDWEDEPLAPDPKPKRKYRRRNKAPKEEEAVEEEEVDEEAELKKLIRPLPGQEEKLEEDVVALEDKVRLGRGTILVNVRRNKPFDRNEHSARGSKTNKKLFMAVLGVRSEREGGNGLVGTPLVWSPPEQPDVGAMEEQYGRFGEALKAVFGLSDVEAYCHKSVKLRMGRLKKERPFESRQSDLRGDYIGYTREQLQAVVDDPEVAAAVARGKPRPPFHEAGLAGDDSQDVLVRLVQDLPADDLEGILFVSYDAYEDLAGHCLRVRDLNVREEAKELMNAVFDVWLLRLADESHVAESPGILGRVLRLVPLLDRHNVAREFLEDADGSRRREARGETTCVECGQYFPLVTKHDKAAFRRHRKAHYFSNYPCDCPNTWGDSEMAKRAHVLLVHDEGYVKCPECMVVGKPDGVDRHYRSVHRTSTCEHCGKEYRGEDRLEIHIRNIHTGKAISERISKRKPDAGNCPVCGEYFAFVRNHMKRVHFGQEQTCELCGKVCPHRRSLLNHLARVHMEKKFQCSHCPRKFHNRTLLREHEDAVHLGTRSYECRYPSCTMTYNHTGSRTHHETMSHGQTYPRAVKEGLVAQGIKKGQEKQRGRALQQQQQQQRQQQQQQQQQQLQLQPPQLLQPPVPAVSPY